MAERYDIQNDSDGDVIINDNDLEYGLSDETHIQDTIVAAPGWWKEHPEDGVNIWSYLKSSGKAQQLSRLIKVQLQSDLYIVGVPKVKFASDDKLIIQPNATI